MEWQGHAYQGLYWSPADAVDEVGTANSLKQKEFRKETKKAKAHMVRASNDYLKRLIMEVDTPYQACNDLKTKNSVAKNRQDFKNLGKE